MRTRRRITLATATGLTALALGVVGLESPSSPAASSRAATGLPLLDALTQVVPPAPPLQGSQLLADGWTRVADPADQGLAQGRQLGQGDGWVPVSVPDVADPTLSDESFRGTVWWYARRVAVPAAADGATWALRFNGVRRSATVYVDGAAVAANDDPFAPFEATIPSAKAGKSVLVAVRVDGRRPMDISEGWWNWVGIVRPVWLVPRGRLLADQPAVQGDARCDSGGRCVPRVRVRASVLNRLPEPLHGRARLVVQDAKGTEVVREERDLGTIAGGKATELAIDADVPDGKLWTPSSPVLYRARLELLGGPERRSEQEVLEQIGLRSVTVGGGKLRLNGRELRLRGSSIQEDVPGRGAAMRDGDVARIVDELKASGANVTRAHYSLDERLLDALDRAGIMVWAQTPVYQADRRLKDAAYTTAALRSNRRAVLATRNHPSVIVHSVANELGANADARPATAAYLTAARKDAAALDPTVPPAVDLRSLPGVAPQQAHAQFPVLGLNTYFGWYKGPRSHRVDRFARFAPFLSATRAAYPGAAIVVTEMGAEGIKRGARTVKGSLSFQARYLSRVMNVVDARDDLSGAIYWTLREFAVRPDWTGGAAPSMAKKTGLHRKGLLSYAGKPKPVWTVARQRLDGAVWSPVAPPRVRYGP